MPCITVMPTASATAPGSSRTRGSGTTFATTAFRSRSTSPATCRPARSRGRPSIRCGSYFDAGVTVALCTDGWLMCGVSLTDEYQLAHTQLGFTREELDRVTLNAFESAFLPLPERAALVRRVGAELAAIR